MGAELATEGFKTGEVVTVNFDKVGLKCFFKSGGGGLNDTLPILPIFSLSAQTTTLKITFTELDALNYPYLLDYVFVYNTNDYPTGFKDGTPIIVQKVASLIEREVYVENLVVDTTYYFRVFTRNDKQQVQTMLPDAFESLKIVLYEPPYTLTPLSERRQDLTSSPLSGGAIVSGGGISVFSSASDYYNSEKVHSLLTPLSVARTQLTSSPLADGDIISGGGVGNYNYSKVSDFYNSDKVRSTLTPINEARGSLASSPLAGGVIISGGGVASFAPNYYNSDKIRSVVDQLSVLRSSLTSSPLAGGVGVFGGSVGYMNAVTTVDYYPAGSVHTPQMVHEKYPAQADGECVLDYVSPNIVGGIDSLDMLSNIYKIDETGKTPQQILDAIIVKMNEPPVEEATAEERVMF